jgi:hypothetical protein
MSENVNFLSLGWVDPKTETWGAELAIFPEETQP